MAPCKSSWTANEWTHTFIFLTCISIFSENDKIKRHHTPVFSDVDYSPTQIALRFTMYLGGTEGFCEAYMSMIPNIRQFFPPILKHIVEKKTPFIVHCTAGKDRTGVVCALLQMICGVDEEQIAWEYELTRRCLPIKEEDVNFLKNAIGGESSDAQVRGVLSAKYGLFGFANTM